MIFFEIPKPKTGKKKVSIGLRTPQAPMETCNNYPYFPSKQGPRQALVLDLVLGLVLDWGLSLVLDKAQGPRPKA